MAAKRIEFDDLPEEARAVFPLKGERRRNARCFRDTDHRGDAVYFLTYNGETTEFVYDEADGAYHAGETYAGGPRLRSGRPEHVKEPAPEKRGLQNSTGKTFRHGGVVLLSSGGGEIVVRLGDRVRLGVGGMAGVEGQAHCWTARGVMVRVDPGPGADGLRYRGLRIAAFDVGDGDVAAVVERCPPQNGMDRFNLQELAEEEAAGP